MTKTTFATQKDHQAAASDWFIVDASEHVLGRMAVRIAEALMGKDKPLYTPHVSIGAGVIVINAERVLVTGDKKDDRIYTHWSGYSGGLHSRSLGERLSQSPERLIKDAVRRMLPKSRAGTAMTARLKVYRGAEHPHTAQQPKKLEIPR